MNTNNHAIVISSKGQTDFIGYVTMKRGCPDTREFAESSGKHVTTQGVSLAIGEDATPEAVRKAIELLSQYLP